MKRITKIKPAPVPLGYVEPHAPLLKVPHDDQLLYKVMTMENLLPLCQWKLSPFQPGGGLSGTSRGAERDVHKKINKFNERWKVELNSGGATPLTPLDS
jgi:hypothetical protein